MDGNINYNIQYIIITLFFVELVRRALLDQIKSRQRSEPSLCPHASHSYESPTQCSAECFICNADGQSDGLGYIMCRSHNRQLVNPVFYNTHIVVAALSEFWKCYFIIWSSVLKWHQNVLQSALLYLMLLLTSHKQSV